MQPTSVRNSYKRHRTLQTPTCAQHARANIDTLIPPHPHPHPQPVELEPTLAQPQGSQSAPTAEPSRVMIVHGWLGRSHCSSASARRHLLTVLTLTSRKWKCKVREDEGTQGKAMQRKGKGKGKGKVRLGVEVEVGVSRS